MKTKKLLFAFTIILISFSVSISAQEGYKSYEEGGKYGMLDKSGKKLTSAKYGYGSFKYYDGLCKVEKDNKWGYIDKYGIEIIPVIYEIASDFKSGKAVVCKDTLVYAINTKGKLVSPRYKASLATGFSKNIFTLQIADDNGLEGFYNMWDGTIMPNFYDFIYKAENDMHGVKINNKYGFTDTSGNEIIPPIYDEIFNFNEKVAIVRIDSKFGVIDKKGKTIVPHKYYRINDFSEGLAAVQIGDFFTKYGFLDEKGSQIIPVIYDYAGDFENGRAEVQILGETFYINKKGERIK